MKKILLYAFVIAVVLTSCTGKSNKKLSLAEELEIEQKADSIVRAKMAGVVNPSESPNGIWKLDHYVDEFGEKSDKAFLLATLEGQFSNSATNNSYLIAELLVNSENDIDIMLREYGSSPVTTGIEDGYKIRVKANDGSTHDLRATNYSDRLSLSKSDAKKFSDILKAGGKVIVAIAEISDYYSSTYRFTISDTKGYEAALNNLK